MLAKPNAQTVHDHTAATRAEVEFVEALVALDSRAWRELFEANYTRMYRYAYVRLGNVADAEDVAASVFTEAVRGIGSFQYRGIPVAGWLFRIAHNQTVDTLRRRQRQPVACNGDPSADHADLARTVDRLDIGEAMGRLKQEHREVLVLRFIDDRSLRDTAQIMRKSDGAVRVLQLRALRSLRKKLGER